MNRNWELFKGYTFSFNRMALLIFFIIMIPNFYWFIVSAPNDILKSDSVTPIIDTIATITQILMIFGLAFIRNKKATIFRFNSNWIVMVLICCLAYYVAWIIYYQGIIQPVIILSLSLFPSLAFLFYAIDRKNWVVVMFAITYTILHLIYGIINYIM
ncbi:hypothetical protein [Saliterribacillus persicus]|uniref:TspO/MBR related protein n=1 Tax=Saliterribacillus persicus TaxID=930114 RepID=A0A368YC49_9BACI|nr:hypothetical protein [Saliterribacillus persicus]RCW76916.1 hypothetical protein DFR57_102191 [Saliterribacillus persicus]